MGQLESLSAIVSMTTSGGDSQSPEKIPKSLASFWWDRIIFLLIILNITIVTIETALGIVDSDHQVRCYIKEELTPEQVEYLNSLCLSDVPEFSKYIRLLTFSQVAILSALQYFWHLVSGSGKTENFLISLAQMKFVREKETGKFSAEDLDIARRLQYRFGRSQRKCQSPFCGRNTKQSVYCSYLVLKLILQFFLCVAFIVAYSIIIRSKMRQRHTFVCRNSNNDSVMPSGDENITDVAAEWPLSVFAVSCTFIPLVSLTQLQYFNITILLLICICLLMGFFVITVVPFSSKKILYKDIAKFVAYTGLRADHFHKDNFRCCNQRAGLIFRKNDLQFLLLRVYATDYRAGSILRDILIEKEVHQIREDTCCCKGEHEILNKERHTDEHLLIKKNISNCVKTIWNQEIDVNGGFISGDRPNCILVTHETDLLAYILDHHQFKKMLCVNFNPYVIPTPETCAETIDVHSGAPSFLQIPSHHWSWKSTKKQCEVLRSAIQQAFSKMTGINSNSSISCEEQCSEAQEIINNSVQQSPSPAHLVVSEAQEIINSSVQQSPSPAHLVVNSNSPADNDSVLTEDISDEAALLQTDSSTNREYNSQSRSVRFDQVPVVRIAPDHGIDSDDDDHNLTDFSRIGRRRASTDSGQQMENDLLIIFTPLSDKEFGALHTDHRVSKLLKCLSPGQGTYALIYYPTEIGGRRVKEDEFRGKPYRGCNCTESGKIPSCLPSIGKRKGHQLSWNHVPESDGEVKGVFGGVQCKFDVNLYKLNYELSNDILLILM